MSPLYDNAARDAESRRREFDTGNGRARAKPSPTTVPIEASAGYRFEPGASLWRTLTSSRVWSSSCFP